MNTTEEKTQEPTDKTIQSQTIEIYNKGVKAWYQYKKCSHLGDAEDTFYHLQSMIEDGKELLFKNLEPGETDKHLQQVFDDAMTALNTKPNTIEETVNYKEIGDNKIPIVTLTATDGGTCECFQEDIEKTRVAFEKRQYKHHIPTLMNAHNKVFHELVKHSIIKQYDPSYKELREKRKKQRFTERTKEK